MTQATPDWVRRLDAAAQQCDDKAVCTAVQETLVDEITSGRLQLEPCFTAACSSGYARHLLHRGANYSVVVMVWDRGQGTPIHDHDGRWCVECVYQGQIRVRSFDIVGTPQDEIVTFIEQDEVPATKGMAGHLIPPFDYHTIDNPFDELAVTIHVYGGEMEGCHIYQQLPDGRYQRVRRELSYTSL